MQSKLLFSICLLLMQILIQAQNNEEFIAKRYDNTLYIQSCGSYSGELDSVNISGIKEVKVRFCNQTKEVLDSLLIAIDEIENINYYIISTVDDSLELSLPFSKNIDYVSISAPYAIYFSISNCEICSKIKQVSVCIPSINESKLFNELSKFNNLMELSIGGIDNIPDEITNFKKIKLLQLFGSCNKEVQNEIFHISDSLFILRERRLEEGVDFRFFSPNYISFPQPLDSLYFKFYGQDYYNKFFK